MDTNTDANLEKAGARAPVLILSGIPGAGKTATAAALARRLGAAVEVVEATVVTREQLQRLRSRCGDGPLLLAVLAPRLTAVARRAGAETVAQWGHLDEVMRRELGEAGLWLDTSELSATEAAEAIATGFLTGEEALARLPWRSSMTTTFDFPAGSGRAHPDRLGLVDRHFLMQGERPPDLRAVELAELDRLLRLLLFSDGSIVRALTVHSLAPVAVSLVHQEPLATTQRAAACLAIEPGASSVRRRVLTPSGFAESYLVPGRLPEEFLPVLLASPSGIGEALRRFELEARRELLWFGLGAAPGWAGPQGGEALVRAYRIVTGGAPAILIWEGFGVRAEGGRYSLDALPAEVAGDTASTAPA